MKPYVHNPEIFRRHFKGKALPSFKGQRIQRGNGPLFNTLKRVMMPLVSAAAPHLAGAASKLATKAVKSAFPNHPMMHRVVGNVVKSGTNAAVKSLHKKRKSKKSSIVASKRRRKQTKIKRNIFTE